MYVIARKQVSSVISYKETMQLVTLGPVFKVNAYVFVNSVSPGCDVDVLLKIDSLRSQAHITPDNSQLTQKTLHNSALQSSNTDVYPLHSVISQKLIKTQLQFRRKQVFCVEPTSLSMLRTPTLDLLNIMEENISQSDAAAWQWRSIMTHLQAAAAQTARVSR